MGSSSMTYRLGIVGDKVNHYSRIAVEKMQTLAASQWVSTHHWQIGERAIRFWAQKDSCVFGGIVMYLKEPVGQERGEGTGEVMRRADSMGCVGLQVEAICVAIEEVSLEYVADSQQ